MLNTFKIHTHKEYTALMTERNALSTKVGELETMITNLQDMSKDMTEKQAEHNNVITQLKADHEAAITQLKADYDKTISDMKALVAVEAASSETKAISVLASIGVPMAELPIATTAVTAETVVKELEATTDINQRKKIFNQHKELLAKEAGVDLTRWKTK